jgi:tagatose 1,6-diphosphate aldolase GatY/KbaY
MIAGFAELLAAARDDGRAAAGFTVYDLPTAAAVLRAAERLGVGVVLIVSASSFAAADGVGLVAGARALAERAAVPAAVQLDHVEDLEAMRRALDAGVTALMADGSRLDDGANAALVGAAVELAAGYGATVEAELGRIEGDEEVALAAAAGALTDPDVAREFMEATGAACLAVSIGNVHGVYREPPRLDWARLRAIRAAIGHPLSLHGASGLSEEALRTAVGHGIAKVNFNTELRRRWLGVARELLPRVEPTAELLALQGGLADAIEAIAAEKLALLEQVPM